MFGVGALVAGIFLAGFALLERVNHPVVWAAYIMGIAVVVFTAYAVSWKHRPNGALRAAFIVGIMIAVTVIYLVLNYQTMGGPPHPWWFYGAVVAAVILMALGTDPRAKDRALDRLVVGRRVPVSRRDRFYEGLACGFGERAFRGGRHDEI